MGHNGDHDSRYTIEFYKCLFYKCKAGGSRTTSSLGRLIAKAYECKKYRHTRDVSGLLRATFAVCKWDKSSTDYFIIRSP